MLVGIITFVLVIALFTFLQKKRKIMLTKGRLFIVIGVAGAILFTIVNIVVYYGFPNLYEYKTTEKVVDVSGYKISFNKENKCIQFKTEDKSQTYRIYGHKNTIIDGTNTNVVKITSTPISKNKWISGFFFNNMNRYTITLNKRDYEAYIAFKNDLEERD